MSAAPLDEPIVSIIVPVHNTSRYLPSCIDSVLAQGLRSLELIAVDDGSTDESPRILEEYARQDRRVRVIRIQQGGVARARNAALELARGRFVMCLDSDDLLPPNAIEALVAAADKTGAEIVTGVAESFRGTKRWINPQMQEVRCNAVARTTLALSPALSRDASPCNKIISRALIAREELCFPDGIDIREDLHFVLRAYAAATSITVLPTVIYHYRVRNPSEAQSLTQRMTAKMIRDLLWVHADLKRSLTDRISQASMLAFDQGILANVLYRLPSVIASISKDDAIQLLGDVADFSRTLPDQATETLNSVHEVLIFALLKAGLLDSAAACCTDPIDEKALTELRLGAAAANATVAAALMLYQQRWLSRLQARIQRRSSHVSFAERFQRKLARWRRELSRSTLREARLRTTGALKALRGAMNSSKPVWLIGERRGNSAQDTGWQFYRYLREKRPDIDAYFVTKRENLSVLPPDDHIVPYASFASLRLLLVAEAVVYSDGCRDITPYWNRVRDDVGRHAVGCFLQHGVIGLNSMRGYYTRPAMDSRSELVDVFVVSSNREAELVHRKLMHPRQTIAVTGLSRFDRLSIDVTPERQVLIIPTWRSWLRSSNPTEVVSSAYFRRYSHLLQSPELAAMAAEFQVQFVFCPHFVAAKHFHQLREQPGAVRLIDPSTENVQDLIQTSMAAVTDYSSVAFDFAYLRRPVCFYMFDRDRWTVATGNLGLDLERDLFGDISFTQEQLLASLRNVLQRGGTLTPEQADRADSFFAFRDQHHSARICAAISSAVEARRLAIPPSASGSGQ